MASLNECFQYTQDHSPEFILMETIAYSNSNGIDCCCSRLQFFKNGILPSFLPDYTFIYLKKIIHKLLKLTRFLTEYRLLNMHNRLIIIIHFMK